MTNKEALLIEILNNFNETFEKRPGMLGKTYQIEAMFCLVDQLSFIQEYEEELEAAYSWNSYLSEKKYIVQGANVLEKLLLESPEDYILLQSLRKDYQKWVKGKKQKML